MGIKDWNRKIFNLGFKMSATDVLNLFLKVMDTGEAADIIIECLGRNEIVREIVYQWLKEQTK